MPKKGDRRPSEHCPKRCDGDGCYEEYIILTGQLSPRNTPKPIGAWATKCKTLIQVNKSLGF